MKKVLVIVVLFVCGIFCFAEDKSKAIYYTVLDGKVSQSTEILLEAIKQINQLNKDEAILEKVKTVRNLWAEVKSIEDDLEKETKMNLSDYTFIEYGRKGLYIQEQIPGEVDYEYIRLTDEEAIKLRDYLIRIYGVE